MIYRNFGSTNEKISVIGLGGHEFHPDGKPMGFSDSVEATLPGYEQSGFGGENRKAIVSKALDLGINLFDLTLDPEIKAMGRMLGNSSAYKELFIQTRPQGMVYNYDPENKKMANYSLLKAEVIRLLRLLKRDRIDILNFAFMKQAIDADPEYIDKIGSNIGQLKKEGFIRFASADTFSGNDTYVKQIASGYFDSIFINYGMRDTFIEDLVIPKVKERHMAVIGRELFMKGNIFKMAQEAGYDDKNWIAKTALKWVLSKEQLTSVMLGVANPMQLEKNVDVLENPKLSDEEVKILERIFRTEMYKKEYKTRSELFYNEKF